MNITIAVLAGFVSSLGSVFGKLSSLFKSENELGYVFVVLVCFAFMILCNVSGMFLFTKSLQEMDSSIVATVTSTACNYMSSGIFGALLFDETISMYWLFGMAFTIFGSLEIRQGVKISNKCHPLK